MPPLRRIRVTHDSGEEEDSTTTTSSSSPETYTLSFASLTISQLQSPSKPKFRFRASEKALVAQHMLTHAYTDKLPPSALNIFLDLAMVQIPVPRDQGLHVIEMCLQGLEGLVTGVVKTLEGNGLMCHSPSRKNVGSWVVDVSEELMEWGVRKGGWDVVSVKLPVSSPKSLARQARDRGSGYVRMENRAASLSTWTELRREAMDFFARQQISPIPATPQQQQQQQLQPLGQARSFYTPSTYTTIPLRDRINQKRCYGVFLNYVRRTQQALAEGQEAGREVLNSVVKSVAWNQQGLEFVRGNDYVQWQFKMCKDGLLIQEDFGGKDDEEEEADGEENAKEE
ncbi:hypothetical protein AC578_6816 [Pseudocercospora eumusae]|uniref:Uncharacterized protein n=1 Tax=Pseudocercospora eumusae TaxID=321146 RepID=A0A139H4M5_9PEZI|nr:hypothetical protein AC578_6816 [Pseudocercospora eumusae]